METILIRVVGGYKVKANILVIIKFNYNEKLEEVFRKIHFSKKLSQKDIDLLDKYTRHALVNMGLVNWVEYYIWYKDFKPIHYRTSKRVRYSPETKEKQAARLIMERSPVERTLTMSING